MAPKSSRKPAAAPKGKSARSAAQDPVAAFLATVPTVPASELSAYLNYAEPCIYKPQTSNLANLRMEADDIQILRYLFRNSAPKRHLEFGTWEGRTTRACLEESGASVWTINLREGETRSDGQWAYTRSYAVEKDDGPPGRYKGMGHNARDTERENRTYQTDAFNFIGRMVHEASLGHRVCQILCDSREWDISAYPPSFFDSVLLDGGHDAQTVISDTRKALALLRDGGLLLWHDFCPDPAVFKKKDSSCSGVIAGLAEIWKEIEPQLSRVFWIRTTWLLVGIKAAREITAPVALPAGSNAGEKPRAKQAATLESAAAELRSEIRQFSRARDNYQRSQAQVLDLQSHIAVLEKRLSAALKFEEDFAVLQGRFLVLEEQLGTLTSERDQLQQQLAKAGDEKSETLLLAHKTEGERELLRDRLEEVEGQCRALTDERDAVQSQVQRMESDHASLSKRIEDLSAVEERKAAAEVLAARLTAERDATARDLTAAKDVARDVQASKEAEVQRLTAEMAALTERLKEIDRLRSDVAELQTALAEKVSSVQELTAQISALDVKLSQSDAARAHADEKVVSLEGDLRGQRKEKADLAQDLMAKIAALDVKLGQSEVARAHADERIVSLEGDLRGQRDRADELIAANGSLEALIADRDQLVQTLTALRDEILAKNEELNRQVAGLNSSNESLSDKLGRQERHNGEVRGDRDFLAGEVQALRQQLEEQVRQHNMARDSALLASISAAERQVGIITAERDNLAERRAEIASALRQEEERLAQIMAEKTELGVALRGMEGQARTLRGERDTLDMERARLAEKYRDLTGEAEKLSSKIEDYRAIVQDYEGSTSWRITAPARFLGKFIRKIIKGRGKERRASAQG